jgi:hypothetical protein
MTTQMLKGKSQWGNLNPNEDALHKVRARSLNPKNLGPLQRGQQPRQGKQDLSRKLLQGRQNLWLNQKLLLLAKKYRRRQLLLLNGVAFQKSPLFLLPKAGKLFQRLQVVPRRPFRLPVLAGDKPTLPPLVILGRLSRRQVRHKVSSQVPQMVPIYLFFPLARVTLTQSPLNTKLMEYPHRRPSILPKPINYARKRNQPSIKSCPTKHPTTKSIPRSIP